MYGSETPGEGAYDDLVDEVNFKHMYAAPDSPDVMF